MIISSPRSLTENGANNAWQSGRERCKNSIAASWSRDLLWSILRWQTDDGSWYGAITGLMENCEIILYHDLTIPGTVTLSHRLHHHRLSNNTKINVCETVTALYGLYRWNHIIKWFKITNVIGIVCKLRRCLNAKTRELNTPQFPFQTKYSLK